MVVEVCNRGCGPDRAVGRNVRYVRIIRQLRQRTASYRKDTTIDQGQVLSELSAVRRKSGEMPPARWSPILNNDIYPLLRRLLPQVPGDVARLGKAQGPTQNQAPQCQVSKSRTDFGNSCHIGSRPLAPNWTLGVRVIQCKPVATGRKPRILPRKDLGGVLKDTKGDNLSPGLRVRTSWLSSRWCGDEYVGRTPRPGS